MTKLSRLYAVLTAYFVIINVIPSSALKGGYEDLHIYHYKAEISVGVEEPAEYASKYSLQGLVKVQRDINQISVSQYNYLISLTDVKHDTYYGEDTIRIKKYQPIDEQLLGNAFTAVYKPNGQLKSTVFNKNEAQWSKQIKLSIARLLQFNWSDAPKDLNKKGQMHFATVEEISIHGKCFVNYNTTVIKNASKTNKKINLVKIIHPTKCNDFVRNFSGYGINDKAIVDEIKTRLDHKKTKINTVYELEIIKNQPIVTKIFNFERYRINYKSDTYAFSHNPQFVKVRQNLFLKNIEPGHEFLHSTEKVATDNNNNNENEKINQEEVINKVKNLLSEVRQIVHGNNLPEIKSGTEHRQLFNRIHHYLKYLDINGFEKLYNDVKISETETLRQVFAQIIPFVGTKSSLSFIKTMLMEQKVSDADAIYLISIAKPFPNSDKILTELDILLKKNNGLSPKVQQAAAHSFSCLISKICKNSPKSEHVSMEKYIQNIDELMKDAMTMDAKLAYLTALGNTQCHGAIKYMKTILPRKRNDPKDQFRLRMVAIWMLMPFIDSDDTDVLDELAKILYDNNEKIELRLTAYKVLVDKSDFDPDDLIEIGRKISTNEYLQKYHLTTMQNLNQIGLLSHDVLSKIDSKTFKLSTFLLTNIVLKLDDSLKLGLIESYFKLKSKFARIVVFDHFNLKGPLISIPALVEFEAFDIVDGKIIVNEAIHYHSNFNSFINDDEKNADERVFIDIPYFKNDRHILHPIELSKKIIDDLNIEEFLKDTVDSLMKPWFLYNDLQTFAIPTGFGIDVVYQNRKPTLLNIKSSYNLSLTMDSWKAQIKFSYDDWIHGYSDISFNNPISQLKHSTRKTLITESTWAAGIIGKYDFSKHSFELIIPLVSKDPQLNIKKSSSVYISSSVMITDRDDELSCPICGYQYTTKAGSVKYKNRFQNSMFKQLGLTSNTVMYNCDLPESLHFADTSNPDLLHPNIIISSCGIIGVMELDTPVSQIEFLVDVDELKLIKSTSIPWYFNPGFELNVDAHLGIRKSSNHDIAPLGKINMILTSSQGHFLNEGRLRLTMRLDDDTNFNVCLDGKASFPNVTDIHMPSKVTNLKLFCDIHMSFGKFKDEFCTGAKHSFEVRFTGEIPPEYLNDLEQNSRNSKCAKQMKNSLFVYPSGSYLLTKNCLIDLIPKTSARRFRIDFKSDEIPTKSLITILLAIEQIKISLKEAILRKYNLDVDVKSLSLVPDIVLNKTISLQMDVKDHYSKMALSLPNFYFPANFLQDFINNNYRVVNVYPKLVLFNNIERKDLVANLKNWTFIVGGDDEESSYEIYVKLLDDDKLTFKLLQNSEELRLEPSIKKGDSSSNREPRIFYNDYIDDFSERAFLKSGEDISFCLLKVDGYLVVHPTNLFQAIIYYSVNSVTIFQPHDFLD